MGILDRPLFRRKLSKNELAMYGIQAFANGGIVRPYNMAEGGPTDPSQLLPQTPPEEMYEYNFKSARERLLQSFMKKLNESGFMEELKKAQESGNKKMEATLVNMYKEMYQKEVVDPVEKGSASENSMGFNKGGDVKGYFSGSEVKKEEDGLLGGFSSTRGPRGKKKETTLEVNTNTSKNQSGKYAGKKVGDIIEESEIQEEKDGVQFKIIRKLVKGSKGELRLGGEEKIITFTPEKVIKIRGGEKTLKGSGEKTDVKSNTETTATDSGNFAKTADQDPSNERENIRTLEEMVKERSDLYKSMLGDPKKQLAMQGYMQLAQFGLNLASAQGSNFAAKVANSAKDPLAAFAALGRQAQQDDDAITLAAIKSSEDERSQSLKPGGFAVLVNDLMNTDPNLDTDAAVAKAFEVYAAKSGKTDADLQNEYFDILVESYTSNDSMSTDLAIAAAEKEVARRFGSKTDAEKTTETPVIKVTDDD